MKCNKNCFMYISLISVLFLFFFRYFNYLTIMNDDYFFLSERLFYAQSDTTSWLEHILLFNQTRWTWIGDTNLLRPGLFIIQYIYFEFLFQLSPKITALFITIGNVFSLMGVFLLLKKHSGAYFALIILCTLAFVEKGSMVYTWGHIQPYVLSIGCFCWWLISRQKSRFSAFFLLACASFLHDIFGILCIILMLLLFIKVIRFSRDAKLIILRDLDILIIGVLNIFTRFTIYKNYASKPASISDYINYHVVSDIFNHDLLFDYTSNFIKEVTLDTFGSLTIPVFISLICLSVNFFILSLKRNRCLTLSIPLIFFVILFSIIYFGRVVPRGNFGEWYTVFFRFSGILLFLNIFIILEKAPKLLRQAKRIRFSYIFGTLIFLGSFSNIEKSADFLLAEKTIKLESFETLIQISNRISALDDTSCFGGIISEKSSKVGETNIWSGKSDNSGALPIREIIILFYKSLCNDVSKEPNYLEYKESEFSRWIHMEKDLYQRPEKLKPKFFQVDAEAYLQKFKNFRHKLTPQNYFEATLQQADLIQLSVFKTDFEASTLNLKFQTDTSKEVHLYNRGIVITPTNSKYPTTIIVLRDNDLVVWQSNNTSAGFEIVASSSLPYSKDSADIAIKNNNSQRCSVMLNDIILAMFNECLPGSVNLEIFEIPNGTPAESILEVSYS